MQKANKALHLTATVAGELRHYEEEIHEEPRQEQNHDMSLDPSSLALSPQSRLY